MLHPATVEGLLSAEKAASATHGAWVASDRLGLTFTVGAHTRALGVLQCPAQGIVSVWRYGAIPAALRGHAIKWVLVRGGGCQLIRRWEGEPAYPATGGATCRSLELPSAPDLAWPSSGVALLDRWIADLAEEMQLSEYFVGVQTVSALSAALCAKLSVSMRDERGELWSEPIPAWWTLAIAPSGAKKSPLFHALAAPWEKAQEEATAALPRATAEWLARTAVARREQEMLLGVRRKSKGEGGEFSGLTEEQMERLTEVCLAANEPQPTEVPLVISDFTSAALSIALAQQPAVWVGTAEAEEMFRSLQNDEGGVDLSKLLKAYSGEHPGTTRRVGRVQPTAVKSRAAFTCAIQPFALYARGTALAVKGQGLFARLHYVAIDRPLTGRASRRADRAAWASIVRKAWELPGVTRDAWCNEIGSPTKIVLNAPQTARLLALGESLAQRALPGGDCYTIDTWTRKRVGDVARLAAVMTVARCLAQGRCVLSAETPCNDAALDWSLGLIEGLAAHARYAVALMSWPANIEDAQHLLALVRATPRRAWLLGDLVRLVPEWSPGKVEEAAHTLADHGVASLSGRTRAERLVEFVS